MNAAGVVGTGGLRNLGRAYLRRRYAYSVLYAPFYYGGRAGFRRDWKLSGLIELFLAANLLAAVMPVGPEKVAAFC